MTSRLRPGKGHTIDGVVARISRRLEDNREHGVGYSRTGIGDRYIFSGDRLPDRAFTAQIRVLLAVPKLAYWAHGLHPRTGLVPTSASSRRTRRSAKIQLRALAEPALPAES